jgi:fused signal recognition particle receptor
VKKDSWFSALSKTRQTALNRLGDLFGATELDEDFWDNLEATLVQADMGIGLATQLIEELKRAAKDAGIRKAEGLLSELRQALIGRLTSFHPPPLIHKPFVIIVIGVNGSGKTTTVSRLAQCYLQAGCSVLLAAADTYRAAAKEQLQRWADELDIEVVSGQPGSDPGAVVHNAAQSALSRKADVLIIDTSGRMHTHHNLMAELQKICRVAGKIIEGAPHQVLLVLDATTGQNGLSQAKAFAQSVEVDGIVLAKLDNSARGGIGFAVTYELGLPIGFRS